VFNRNRSNLCIRGGFWAGNDLDAPDEIYCFERDGDQKGRVCQLVKIRQTRLGCVSELSGESLSLFSWLAFQTLGAPVLFVLQPGNVFG
jgi:hypothetical protein